MNGYKFVEKHGMGKTWKNIKCGKTWKNRKCGKTWKNKKCGKTCKKWKKMQIFRNFLILKP